MQIHAGIRQTCGNHTAVKGSTPEMGPGTVQLVTREGTYSDHTPEPTTELKGGSMTTHMKTEQPTREETRTAGNMTGHTLWTTTVMTVLMTLTGMADTSRIHTIEAPTLTQDRTIRTTIIKLKAMTIMTMHMEIITRATMIGHTRRILGPIQLNMNEHQDLFSPEMQERKGCN